MKHFMRKRIDYNAPINQNDLGPLQKIFSAVVVWRMGKDSYKNKLRKKESKERKFRLARETAFKKALLKTIHTNLVNDLNKSVKDNNDSADSLILTIPREYEDIIDTVLAGKDFRIFIVKKYRENPDLLRSEPTLPILVEFKQMEVGYIDRKEDTDE